MSSLLERYTYGQSEEWEFPYGNVRSRMLSEMLVDGPERQSHMIDLARRQIDAQRYTKR